MEKIGDALNWRVTTSVKEHFNKAGKLEAFAAEATDVEKNEQKNAMKGLFFMSESEATLATLKATDIFMAVARRVGNDAELAALLPAGKFDKTDIEILEKCQLKSLADLIRIKR
ncbi:MAG: hypothetical protein HY052_01055 [Proteobacteria bacterium]|nr:hypothetical protein [Pseudomonadota bacterium]